MRDPNLRTHSHQSFQTQFLHIRPLALTLAFSLFVMVVSLTIRGACAVLWTSPLRPQGVIRTISAGSGPEIIVIVAACISYRRELPSGPAADRRTRLRP
jgi:hypothetical protein